MSRTLRASILLLLLASCGGGNFSAPRNLDDACAILRQRPTFLKAMKATERRWGNLSGIQVYRQRTYPAQLCAGGHSDGAPKLCLRL
jgi:hypothetical protein